MDDVASLVVSFEVNLMVMDMVASWSDIVGFNGMSSWYGADG